MNPLTIVVLLNGALLIAYVPIYFTAWSETDKAASDPAGPLDPSFGLLLTSPHKFNLAGRRYRLYGALIEVSAYLSWVFYFLFGR